ncbi:heavy metal-associated isoprenylated plant protein 39-like [Arachis duranensis]|uniref:Heavy metal-associated isoprenylated plant protein 39-like n=1 Tax=Arachis duranensis TaxID=130453 RepID=A0A6P4DBI6_ARADU|nr:heavy metal-associated isoprenylated plant protein 39-like [Arachis duranensis]
MKLSDEIMKLMILNVNLHDEKAKQKAMKVVSSIKGIESIAMEMKEKKMTVVGDFDAVKVVITLRKICHTDIVSLGPTNNKKDEGSIEKGKKDGDDKNNKDDDSIAELVKLYKTYNPHMTMYYNVHSLEDNPNACIIL